MAKDRKTAWNVIREYKNLYSLEEILRMILRRHLEQTNQHIV